MMYLDPLGLPYLTQYGPDFATDNAADLGEFTPPATLEVAGPSGNARVRQQEAEIPAEHFGAPLSHHAQQATALKYVRDNRGFDSVCSLRVHYTEGDATLYVQSGTEFWVEIPCA